MQRHICLSTWSAQLGLTVQFPRRHAPTLVHSPIPSPSTIPQPIISLPDVISQIRRGVPLCLRDPIAEVLEPIPAVPELPVLPAHLPHRLEIVQRASRPGRWYATTDAVIVVRVAAVVGPDGLSGHEVVDLRREISTGARLRVEAVDRGLRLVAINEGAYVVCLSFDGNERRPIGYRRVRAQH